MQHRSCGPVAILAVAIAFALPAAAAAAARTVERVVPIEAHRIEPTGEPRYAIRLRVNGQDVVAGLDTGSVGLRLLPRAVARIGLSARGSDVTFSYGSGVALTGPLATATVEIGGMQGAVQVQAVTRVGCVARKPRCPGVTQTPAAFGLMGSGHPGQGFEAILGVRMIAGDRLNPLTAIGVGRWLIHLPRGGEGDGMLVLAPAAARTEGFVPLTAEPNGTVAGCLSLAGPGAQALCGPTLLDTGATEIAVRHADRPAGWMPGAPASLSLQPRQAQPVVLRFAAGDQAVRTRATFDADAAGPVTIAAGVAPFYALDVLYDADRDVIAVRPLDPAPGLAITAQ